MVKLGRANHCVYKIGYHVVLCIKYRKKLLFGIIKLNISSIEAQYQERDINL